MSKPTVCRYARGRALALAALALAIGACAGEEYRPVPEADARKVLDEAVAHGLAADDDKLCKAGQSVKLCDRIVREAAGRRPTEPPRVVGTRRVAPEGDQAGGLVLELEGRDRTGESYRSDFLVVDTGEGPKPQQPVWWAGIKVGG